MSEDDPTPSDSVDPRYTILEVQDEDDSLAWGLHALGRGYLDHLSTIKLRYKKLALTWLTAVLIALSYIAAGQETLFLNQMLFITFVTLLADIGIRLLRFLDLRVYHVQLRALYITLVEMEQDNYKLTKPYSQQSKLLHFKHFDPVVIDSLHYSAFSICILSLGAAALYYRIGEQSPIIGLIVCYGIIAGVFVLEGLSAILAIKEGASRFL